MKVGQEAVFLAMPLFDHSFILQCGNQVDQLVSTERNTDRGIGLPQRVCQFLRAVCFFLRKSRFQRLAMLCFGDVTLGIELFPLRSARILFLDVIVIQQFRQCLLVDAEGEGFEVHRPDMSSPYRTDVCVCLILLN